MGLLRVVVSCLQTQSCTISKTINLKIKEQRLGGAAKNIICAFKNYAKEEQISFYDEMTEEPL